MEHSEINAKSFLLDMSDAAVFSITRMLEKNGSAAGRKTQTHKKSYLTMKDYEEKKEEGN